MIIGGGRKQATIIRPPWRPGTLILFGHLEPAQILNLSAYRDLRLSLSNDTNGTAKHIEDLHTVRHVFHRQVIILPWSILAGRRVVKA